MTEELITGFCWNSLEEPGSDTPPAEQYQKIVRWAGSARGQNPKAFDAVTAWLLEDREWPEERLPENRRILVEEIVARFRAQNKWLHTQLTNLDPSGVVNKAVFPALRQFDDALSGILQEKRLKTAVQRMFADFSVLKERSVRETIAGGITGPTGTDAVEIFGYINCLKDLDASVQWTLFMPDVVRNQQDGFRVDHFEYRKMPAMRFIGQKDAALPDAEARKALFQIVDTLNAGLPDLDYDLLLVHHSGRCVDVEPGCAFWGRFLKADTPVPEGLLSFDFLPRRKGTAGPPFLSQFAFATFSGDLEAMHRTEGYDSDAMYDVTRNIMLGQGVTIPYPDKYWTAAVFPNGSERPSTAYLFSAELE